MRANGSRAEKQALRDVLIGQTLGDQTKDIELARSEPEMRRPLGFEDCFELLIAG